MVVLIEVPVDEGLVADIDSLAHLINNPWRPSSREDIARIGLAIGIASLKAQAAAMMTALAGSTGIAGLINSAMAHSAFGFGTQPADSAREPLSTATRPQDVSSSVANPSGAPGENDPDEVSAAAPEQPRENVTPTELNPASVRAKLNRALQGKRVDIKDLAAKIGVSKAHVYGFRRGGSMSANKLAALDAALTRRSAPRTVSAVPESAEDSKQGELFELQSSSKTPASSVPSARLDLHEVRTRFNNALGAGHVRVGDIAEATGIASSYLYAFKGGSGMGQDKLHAIDRALRILDSSDDASRPDNSNAVSVPPAFEADTYSIGKKAPEEFAPAPEFDSSDVRERLREAVQAGRITIPALAQATGISATYLAAFKSKGTMGQEKLRTLIAALADWEKPLTPDGNDQRASKAPSETGTSRQPPSVPLGKGLRNRPNVVPIPRVAPFEETPGPQPAWQTPIPKPLTPEEMAARILEALKEARADMTIAQIQAKVHEPAVALNPVLTTLIVNGRVDATDVGGIVAYRLREKS